MTAPLYVTDANLKVWLEIDAADTADDARITAANLAAKAAIDNFCGRHFDVAASADRYFTPLEYGSCPIDDFASITAVATDAAADGTYSTVWDAGDWYACPIGNIGPAGQPGWPFTEIVAAANQWFRSPTSSWFPSAYSRRPFVKVTGTPGWTAVPDDVALAARLYGAELFKLHEAPFGTSWTAEGNQPIIVNNRPLRDLLAPYKRFDKRFVVA